MRTLQQAIDWAHREEPPHVYISSFPRKTQKALQLLVAEVHRLGHAHDVAQAEVERLTAERDMLRSALITTGRNLGAGLGDEVSSEFLAQVADEALAVRKKAEAVRG